MRGTMSKFVIVEGKLSSDHAAKLAQLVHDDGLEQELAAAIACATTLARSPEWNAPLGRAAATSTPEAVSKTLFSAGAPETMVFGGALGMLDLTDRVKPIDDLDVGRMRWAAEFLDTGGKLTKLLNPLAVRA